MHSKYGSSFTPMEVAGRVMFTSRSLVFKPARMRLLAGFTIIEVLLSTIILAISLVGGTLLFSANRKNLTYAAYQTLATWSGVSKLEELKSADYSSLINGITIETPVISGHNFQRKTTIKDVSGYKEVNVEVDWGKGTFPVSLTTYVSEKL